MEYISINNVKDKDSLPHQNEQPIRVQIWCKQERKSGKVKGPKLVPVESGKFKAVLGHNDMVAHRSELHEADRIGLQEPMYV